MNASSLRTALAAAPLDVNELGEANAGAGNGEPFAHGEYFVCRAPSLSKLRENWLTALGAKHPLVLLPPVSAAEEVILLRQLPTAPPKDAVLVLFTSGTTGTPKAVFHGERSLLTSGQQLLKAFGPHPRLACLLPAWGMAGLAFQLLYPAAAGGGTVLENRGGFLQWSHSLDGILSLGRCSLLVANPMLLKMWLRNDRFTWRGRTVSFTAPMGESLRERWRAQLPLAPLEEGYGMSEAAGPVLLEGKSLGAHLRLSSSGELELGGDQLLLGYGSEGKFLPASGWFATGDLFAEGKRGWEFRARLRELIDLGGRKVAPGLIEEVFLGMPEIAECLVFPKMIEGIERAALVYVRATNCTLAENELSAEIERRTRTSLSLEVRPAWWREVKEIPRLAGGKADRKRVRSEWS